MSADRLARTLRRWGRAQRARARAADDARALAERLDERGCGYGRVLGARLEEVARAHERLEAKLNAVLLAVIATFVSTMLAFVVQALRAGG